MSVQAMAWVIENSQTRGNQYIVLLMIANRADEDGASAWPSVRWIAKRCRLGERTVQRCLRKLEKAGLLFIEYGTGRRNTNTYHIVMQPSFTSMLQKGCQIDTPSIRTKKGVRAVSPDSSYTSKYKTPLPPADAGDETFLDYHGTTVAVKMGARKRLPSPGPAMHPPYYVEFLNNKGFPARIIEKE